MRASVHAPSVLVRLSANTASAVALRRGPYFVVRRMALRSDIVAAWPRRWRPPIGQREDAAAEHSGWLGSSGASSLPLVPAGVVSAAMGSP